MLAESKEFIRRIAPLLSSNSLISRVFPGQPELSTTPLAQKYHSCIVLPPTLRERVACATLSQVETEMITPPLGMDSTLPSM
jgi:hypothetical protein